MDVTASLPHTDRTRHRPADLPPRAVLAGHWLSAADGAHTSLRLNALRNRAARCTAVTLLSKRRCMNGTACASARSILRYPKQGTGPTCADTLTNLFRRDDVGRASRAEHSWHCPGCTRTADVDCIACEVVRLIQSSAARVQCADAKRRL